MMTQDNHFLAAVSCNGKQAKYILSCLKIRYPESRFPGLTFTVNESINEFVFGSTVSASFMKQIIRHYIDGLKDGLWISQNIKEGEPC